MPAIQRAVSGFALFFCAVPAWAQTPAEFERRIAILESEVATLRAHAGSDRLTEERADEIRALIADVLADAETRALALDGGGTAGWDKGFFLRSADDSFRLNVKGLLQVRHAVNHRDGAVDGTTAGFQVMRANLLLDGHLGDPRVGWALVLAQDRDNGAITMESARLDYQINDRWALRAGRCRNLAFLREERISYAKQLSVERSFVNEVFTVDYVEGAALTCQDDAWRLQAAVHDGTRSAPGDFDRDRTDLALNGRVDIKLAGAWSETEDFTALGTEAVSSLIGAAIDYEIAETGTAAPNDRFLAWTIDGSMEQGGASLFAAAVGRHGDNQSTPDVDQLGFVIQGSWLVTPSLEPFVRLQWIDFDGFTAVGATPDSAVADDELRLLTAGLNWYVKAHALKLTVEVTHAFDPVPLRLSHTGLLRDADGEDGQTVLITQFQLMF